MKVGIALDTWKQKTFEKTLTAAGYAFKRGKGMTVDTMMLYVEIEDLPGEPEKLSTVIQAAMELAKKTKLH